MSDTPWAEVHIVSGVTPQDLDGVAADGSTAYLGDRVCLKDYDHVTILIHAGLVADARAVTLLQCTDASNSLSDEKALGFSYQYANVGLSTDQFTKTAVTGNTFNVAASNYNLHRIEVDANTLDMANGFDWIRVNIATANTSATIIGVVYLFWKPKFAAGIDSMPVVIS